MRAHMQWCNTAEPSSEIACVHTRSYTEFRNKDGGDDYVHFGGAHEYLRTR